MEVRDVVAEYLKAGKLLQVATVSRTGPRISNVWYAFSDDLAVITFTSNKSRNHSEDVRLDAAVAGSVIAIPLEGLGQKVRGLTFQGSALETQGKECIDAYKIYAKRWPQVAGMFTAEDILTDATPMRMYLIHPNEYVLWDEVNFPGTPRQTLSMRSSI